MPHHAPTPNIPEQLDAQAVRLLLDDGMSQSDIAKAYSKSRQYVNQLALSLRNRPKTLREQAMEQYPWDLSQFVNIWRPGVPFSAAYIDRLLRDHLEFLAVGNDLSLDKRKRVRSFYRKLKTESKVVEFSPHIEPIRDYNEIGGFAYRDYDQKLDGTRMLRVNEYTQLDEIGEVYWQLPDEWPSTEYVVSRNGAIG